MTEPATTAADLISAEECRPTSVGTYNLDRDPVVVVQIAGRSE